VYKHHQANKKGHSFKHQHQHQQHSILTTHNT
jgi:hypothetical protein